MAGIGCETIWLNKTYSNGGSKPLIKLRGNKLIKNEVNYFHNEGIVSDLELGITLGVTSKLELGASKTQYLGIEKMYSIGTLSNEKTKIYRQKQVLGEIRKEFGNKEFEKIGITDSYSQPPTAIILPLTKPPVAAPSSFWDQTLASDLYKKVTTAIKKYFKQRKD